MPLTIIKIFISLTIPTFLGFSVLLFIFRQKPFNILLTLAISYGTGFGLLAQWMLILGLTNTPCTSKTVGTPLIFLSCIFFILYLTNKQKGQPFTLSPKNSNNSHSLKKRSFSIKHYILFCLIGLYAAYNINFVLWRGLNVPILEWDAISTVAFKAKIFFYERALFMPQNLPHASYPLQTPFSLTWLALNLGFWDDQLVKIIFPFIFLSYLTIHYSFLKSLTSDKWALGGIALLLSSNFFTYHATIAYRDFYMLYYNCTTIILLILWGKLKNDNLLLLAALFSGFTTFTKLEGTGYLFIHTFLTCFILWNDSNNTLRKKWKKFLKFIIPSYSICLLYHFYKSTIALEKLSGRTKFVFTLEHLNRIPIILKEFSGNLFFTGNWNLIWLILIFSLLSHTKKIKTRTETRLLLLTLLMFFSLYFSIALFTSSFISIAGAESPTVLSRVFLHFFPLAPLLIITLNYPHSTKKEKTP